MLVECNIEVLHYAIYLLGFVVCIKEQRMVVHAKPGVAVRKIPKCYVVNHVLVFAQYAEHTCILVFLQCGLCNGLTT